MDPSTTNSTKNIDETNPKNASSSTTTTSTTRASIKELSRDYVRSYTCTFCEKGFSNAQALGGHMNIHRRDRARLRNLDDSDLGTKRASNLTMITWERNQHHHDHDIPLLRLFDANPTDERRSNGGDDVDLELRLGSPSSSSARKSS